MSGTLSKIVRRLQGQAARGASYLPDVITRMVVQGIAPPGHRFTRIDPHFNLMAAARPLIGEARLIGNDPGQARSHFKQEMKSVRHRPTPVQAVHDFDIDGPAGPLAIRHYRPVPLETEERLPVIVFFHGGGFVVGNLDTHDEVCRMFCHYARAHVLSVNYRLAPEHKAPAAVEDAVAATVWALENAVELGGNPEQVLVAGDSAGGNLAAVVAQQLRDHQPPLGMQVPLYPVIDIDGNYPSQHAFGKGLFLTGEDIELAKKFYLEDSGLTAADVRVSPLSGVSAGLAPAYVVTAGHDLLHDEGRAYADALQKAGIPTTYECIAHLGHGFLNLTPVNPASRRATRAIAKRTGELVRQLAVAQK